MKTPHTPGPWVFGSYHKLLVVPVIEGQPDKHQPIASLGNTAYPFDATPSDAERYANAALISAAPDLLEALQGFIEGAESMGWSTTKARAAVAKATGETK